MPADPNRLHGCAVRFLDVVEPVVAVDVQHVAAPPIRIPVLLAARIRVALAAKSVSGARHPEELGRHR